MEARDVPPVLAFLVASIAAPAMWIVLLRFVRALRKKPQNGALRVAVATVAWMVLVLSVFGLVFINNDIVPPPVGLIGTQIATRLTMLSSLILAGYILWMYRDSE